MKAIGIGTVTTKTTTHTSAGAGLRLASAASLACVAILAAAPARASGAGSLDLTFNREGFVLQALQVAPQVKALTVDSAGRTVVVGDRVSNSGQRDVFALRIGRSGFIDSTFGLVFLGMRDGSDVMASSVTTDSADRVLVSTTIRQPQTQRSIMSVYRVLADASDLDRDWGEAGIFYARETTGSNFASSIRMLPDPRTGGPSDTAVLAGYSTRFGNDDVELAFISPSGTKEDTFGQDRGITYSDMFENNGDRPVGMEIAPDGRIVVGLNTRVLSGGKKNEVFPGLLTYHGATSRDSGTLDGSFGFDGRAGFTDDSELDIRLAAIAVDRQGRTVGAVNFTLPESVTVDGVRSPGETWVFLTRLTPDGTLDPSFASQQFGRNGRPVLKRFRAKAIAFDSKGRLVIAGEKEVPQNLAPIPGQVWPLVAKAALVRLKPNGKLDRTFGTGKRMLRLPFPTPSLAGMVVDKSDRVLVAGPSPEGFFVARYRSDD